MTTGVTGGWLTGGWLAFPVMVPLLTAAVLVLAPLRPGTARVVAVAASTAVLGFGGVLVAATRDGTVLDLRVGDWPPGVAIGFAADQLSALMLTVTALLVAVCLAVPLATEPGREQVERWYPPLALILSAGVYGAYLTADLFNLFVFLEVMLAPSYVLLVLAGGGRRVAAGRLYLAVSLLASTMYLVGIGLLYGVTGTVNLGDLAGAARGSGAVAAAAGVLLLAMATKAAVVPLHGWLPRAYSHAHPAVAALFSGLLTKVGLYAILRIYAVVFDGDPAYAWLLALAAGLSMVVGGLGAIGERAFRPVLVFSMVSHMGLIMAGVAMFTPAGLAAAVFYLLQYVLAKAALLLCAGAVETTYGTGRLDRLSGLVNRAPLLAVAFIVPALSLAGIPPLSGFVAKLALVRAGFEAGEYVLGGMVIGVGLLTLVAVMRIWTGAFWGHDNEETWREDGGGAAGGGAMVATLATDRVRLRVLAPALVLAAFPVLLGIAAEPVLALTEVAAGGLVDPSGYAAVVSRR